MLVIDALDSTGSSQPLLQQPQLFGFAWLLQRRHAILEESEDEGEEQLIIEEQVVPSVARHERKHRNLLLPQGSLAGPLVNVPLVPLAVLPKRSLIQQLATTPMMKRMRMKPAAKEEMMMKRAAKEVMK